MTGEEEVHGIPALLSFLFPGLGQLVKRQYGRAALIWVFVGIPAFVAVNILTDPRGMTPVTQIVVAVFGVLAVATWLWGVVDAYNSPN